jgi:hypothetical protein
MALLAAGAAFVMTTGVGWYYWSGDSPSPESKKEIKKATEIKKQKETGSLPKGNFIKELKEMGKKKLKPVSERKLSPKTDELTEFEKKMQEIRAKVKPE